MSVAVLESVQSSFELSFTHFSVFFPVNYLKKNQTNVWNDWMLSITATFLNFFSVFLPSA